MFVRPFPFLLLLFALFLASGVSFPNIGLASETEKDPFPDPTEFDSGDPPPLSAGGAGEGSGDAWDDSDTGDGSGR